jgi:hypothetical protein
MLNRDEIKGPSCLTNAADDEPVFVLRANDEIAPEVVLYWAGLYTQRKMLERGGDQLTAKQLAKREEAVRLADQMTAWKRTQK